MSYFDPRNRNARETARMRRYCVDGNSAQPSLVAQEMWADICDGELPERFVVRHGKRMVCPACNGEGRHVAASVDAHGLTQADFNDDPDFAERYFGGAYDVECGTCKGRNVVDGEVECDHPLWHEWREFLAELCADDPWDVAEARAFGY